MRNKEKSLPARKAKWVKLNIMDSQAIQVNSAGELKSLEQTQFNLFLNANLTLKKEVEEYLKKQGKILVNGEEGIRDEVIQELLAMFMEFTKNIIFNQERVKKVENQGKITARDLDDQLHQANLFN
jgi:hypothetical protein